MIGPAQSGKTSMLRCLNRTIDFTANARMSGHGAGGRRGREAHARHLRPAAQDRHGGAAAGGAAAQRSTTTWPSRRAARASRTGATSTRSSSAACGRRRCGTRSRTGSQSLGTALSGGQQQRLTIARALSHQPEILCLDEFSIAIDPVTTMRIEDVLKELRREITIILVTNLTQQARRLADRTMFLWDGEIVEIDRTDVIFSELPEEPAHAGLRERGVRMSDDPPHPAIETRRLNLWYGSFQALKEVTVSHAPGHHHLADRAERLRQDDAAALLQPRQRALRQRAHHRRDPDPGREHLRRRRLAGRAAQGGRAWCSSGRTRCRSRSTRTSCSACASTARRAS